MQEAGEGVVDGSIGAAWLARASSVTLTARGRRGNEEIDVIDVGAARFVHATTLPTRGPFA